MLSRSATRAGHTWQQLQCSGVAGLYREMLKHWALHSASHRRLNTINQAVVLSLVQDGGEEQEQELHNSVITAVCPGVDSVGRCLQSVTSGTAGRLPSHRCPNSAC